MKITGVIAELNPFHNGHAYLFQKARELTGADYCVVIMSGDFVQRGVPALTDKYTRTKAALANGADLVIELPALYATSSAELFAFGAVSMLNRLSGIQSLCFGCETDELPLLEKIAGFLISEPESYREALRQNIRSGMTYPAARSSALCRCFPDQGDRIRAVLSAPNNILAIEYLKALRMQNSPIRPVPILRCDSGFYSRQIRPPYAPATALRSMIYSENQAALSSGVPGKLPDDIQNYIPGSALDAMTADQGGFYPIHEDALSLPLHYRLLSLTDRDQSFSDFLDVGKDFSNRIKKNLYSYQTFTGFSNLCKSKEFTQARVNRGLLHIFLDLRQQHLKLAQEWGYTPYGRVLGCRKEASLLLSHFQKQAELTLFTRPARAESVLNGSWSLLWRSDVHASHLYQMLINSCYHVPMIHEYRRPVLGL